MVVALRGEYLANAIANLIVLPVCLPIYLILLWVGCAMPTVPPKCSLLEFFDQKEFKSITAYNLMFSMGAMDCLYMISGFQAGLMSLSGSQFFALFSQVGSVLRFGYLTSMPIFSALLAINRLTVILRFKKNTLWNVMFVVCITGTWLLALLFPVLLVLIIPSVQISYTVRHHGYVYTTSDLFDNIWIKTQVILELFSLLGYVIIAAAIILQKKAFHASYKISRKEILLVLQGFLLTVPLTIVNLIGWKGNLLIIKGESVYLFWALLAAFLPAINLAVHVVFNQSIRTHLFYILRIRRSSNTVFFIPSQRFTGTSVSNHGTK